MEVPIAVSSAGILSTMSVSRFGWRYRFFGELTKFEWISLSAQKTALLAFAKRCKITGQPSGAAKQTVKISGKKTIGSAL